MTTAKEEILAMKPRRREDLVERCHHCGKALMSLRALLLDEDDEADKPLRDFANSLPFACDCEAAERERAETAAEDQRRKAAERRKRQEAIFAASGMPEAWRERSLALWQTETEEQRLALSAALHFLDDAAPRRSLFIVGDIGCGKTFLASCLARDKHRRGRRVRWARVGDILADIRRSFNSREDSAPLACYKQTACLVLDDLGKERPTEWAVEQLFSLIDSRYNAGLPLIVTSNYGGADLVRRLTPATAWGEKGDPTTGRAIVDRLCAMCEVVTLTGKSWRQ